MYKVIDVAKLFSVSKVTIYKKITANKIELEGHLVKKKNITYLDDEALEIIKNSLQVNREKASEKLIEAELDKMYFDFNIMSETNKKLKNEKISLLDDQILDIESTIRHLQSQVQIKENQLKTKDEILNNFKVSLKINKDRIKVLDRILQEFQNSE